MISEEVRFDKITVLTLCIWTDRQTLANSVDPDQMLQNAASDQGLLCLPLIQQFYTLTGSTIMYLLQRSIG